MFEPEDGVPYRIQPTPDEKACNANHALLITDWDRLPKRASTTSISRHGDREHASCEYGATVHRRMPGIQERFDRFKDVLVGVDEQARHDPRTRKRDPPIELKARRRTDAALLRGDLIEIQREPATRRVGQQRCAR